MKYFLTYSASIIINHLVKEKRLSVMNSLCGLYVNINQFKRSRFNFKNIAMEKQFGFYLMDIDEFANWLAAEHVSRVINLIQNHHTFLPDYTHFTGSNHFARLKSMRDYHMVNNGWSNIAQTLTTFPDGKVAVCRPFNDVPVGIKGHNSKGICIEHFGNFDLGKDQMLPAHRNTILKLNALLCRKFNLAVDAEHIVYHHWYDLNNGLRLNGKGSTKSCPGTAFFGGNKVEDAEAGFIPLIKKEMLVLGAQTPAPDVVVEVKPATAEIGIVTATSLNVRKGPGTAFAIAVSLSAGANVNIYESVNGWLRISDKSEWLSERYVIKARKARVTADSLNIRSGPASGFSKLGSLAKDTSVLVYETRNGWSRIDINEKWVSSQYLS